MTEITDAVLETMERYGGSFVKALARLYQLGDPQNQAILRQAFSHYFAEYADVVARTSARREHTV